MGVLVTGSIAFDHIMSYSGAFNDAIVEDQSGSLNASFLVSSLQRQYGGSGGAIAYNLALLGERPRLIGTVGIDFDDYRRHLDTRGVDTDGVLAIAGVLTAACFITTDARGNQITSFYAGAMAHCDQVGLEALDEASLVVISPNHVPAMVRFVRHCAQARIPFLYEPGQQVLALSPTDLLEGIREASCVCLNDYELAVVASKSSLGPDEVVAAARLLFLTHGEQGSTAHAAGQTWKLPAVPARKTSDPTGAGEAYLAGIVQGLLRSYPPDRCMRVATLAASYAVEEFGTQNHRYTPGEFETRYREAYLVPTS